MNSMYEGHKHGASQIAHNKRLKNAIIYLLIIYHLYLYISNHLSIFSMRMLSSSHETDICGKALEKARVGRGRS